MRTIALGEDSLGACFHGGRHLAQRFVYLLRNIHYCGAPGTLVEEGALVVWRSFTRQIAVGSVAEGGHTAELYSRGGVFHFELTACIWSSYGGFGSIYVGCTMLGRTCLVWTCISA
jgi:hypothetical protein